MRETRVRFSQLEKRDLLKAWALISLAFAIIYARFEPTALLILIPAAAVTVGLGFLVHELAHKFVAIRYGCSAEFRANNTMLWAAVLMSLFGFVFVAPGAVIVQGARGKKESGVISAAGPGSNIALALIFLALTFTLPGIFSTLAGYGALINAWLALFNMIPIMPFDGRKIWLWNKTIYIIMAALAIIITFGQNLLGGLI